MTLMGRCRVGFHTRPILSQRLFSGKTPLNVVSSSRQYASYPSPRGRYSLSVNRNHHTTLPITLPSFGHYTRTHPLSPVARTAATVSTTTASPSDSSKPSPSSSKPSPSTLGVGGSGCNDVPFRFVSSRFAAGEQVVVKGWVRSVRKQKQNVFIDLNDGSQLSNFQVVVDVSSHTSSSDFVLPSVGSGVQVEGVLQQHRNGKSLEVSATGVHVLCGGSPADYPLQKKGHSFEFLRTMNHLRPRTNTIGAVARVRSASIVALHNFFATQDFLCVSTPIISANDCEGAGEQFHITTQDEKEERSSSSSSSPPAATSSSSSSSAAATSSPSSLFFSRPAHLTVSGQLEAEAYALAMSRVYTFGPTFRAEKSHTPHHLSEFWMLEPEMAFSDLDDIVRLCENMLINTTKDVVERCEEDIEFFSSRIDKGLKDRLHAVLQCDTSSPDKNRKGGFFPRLTYTEGIQILEDAKRQGTQFKYPVYWGCDLKREHEHFLCRHVGQKPLFVVDFPKSLKPFYSRVNDGCEEDRKTVAAMDLLIPGIGELVGGSVREERHDLLSDAMVESGVNPSDLDWYLDLRKYGSVPHGGFGMGFERYLQFITGMQNIRDVIPFPRHPGQC